MMFALGQDLRAAGAAQRKRLRARFLRWSQRGGITLDAAVEGTLTEVLR